MRKPFNGEFPVTQTFGNKLFLADGSDYYLRFNLLGHNGIDYGTPRGTLVVAPHSGIITEATFDPFLGKYVKIESKIEGSVLAHLDRIDVQIGFEVKEGDPIGISGNTGGVFPVPSPANPDAGSHLHHGYYRIPRDRANGYNGYIDQTPFLVSEFKPVLRYVINEVIEPNVEIAVGPAPGKEDMRYGKVGPGFPAKIIGVLMYDNKAYYNIDQSAIGGGTGYVLSDLVDKTDKYVEPSPIIGGSDSIPQQEAPSYSEEEYKKLAEERDKALGDYKTEHEELTTARTKLSGFKSLGFESAEELKENFKKYDEQIIDLQGEIVVVKRYNEKLLNLLATKEGEDATAIEQGINAAQELLEAKDHIIQIAKQTGTKPNIFDIIYHIDNFKKLAESTLRLAAKEAEKAKNDIEQTKIKEKSEQLVEINKTKNKVDTRARISYGLDWLMGFFKLRKGVK